MELSAAADFLEGSPRTRCRQYLRAQTQRTHALDRYLAHAGPRGRGDARRGGQSDLGCWRQGRPCVDAVAAGGPGVFHRRRRDGSRDHGCCRFHGEASGPGTWRQEPQRDLRRRGPGRGDRQRPDGDLPRFRPGVFGRLTPDRPRRDPRSGGDRVGPPSWRHTSGGSVRRRRRDGAVDQRSPPLQGARLR